MTEKTPACLSQDAWLVEALKGKQGYGKGMQSKRRLSQMLREGITSAVVITGEGPVGYLQMTPEERAKYKTARALHWGALYGRERSK